jgi:hypothetical protein
MLFFIVIINIHHKLGLDRPVLASSNNIFKGLPTHLHSFALLFSIVFGTLLWLILVTFHGQFDLYLLSFLSTHSTFNSSKISSLLLWSKRVYLTILKNFISTNANHFLSLFLRVQILLPYKRMGTTSVLHTFILENF